MNPHATRFLQRIQEGLPLLVHIERGMAWVEDGIGRRTRFPVRPMESFPMEGTLEATLEVTQGGRFLPAEEISVHPLTTWLGCQQAAVRLVVNRDSGGDPFISLPFELEGIEIVVRPLFSFLAEDRTWKIACLLPCHEVRIYTHARDHSWKVSSQTFGSRETVPLKGEPSEATQFRDRFSELAAALPTGPCSRPYGNPRGDGGKRREDWEGFRMG